MLGHVLRIWKDAPSASWRNLLLVAPFVPSSFLLLLVRPGATSSFLLLVVYLAFASPGLSEDLLARWLHWIDAAALRRPRRPQRPPWRPPRIHCKRFMTTEVRHCVAPFLCSGSPLSVQ